MVQKPVVRTWHREEFKAGKKDNIPAAALAILEAEAAQSKGKSTSSVASEKKAAAEKVEE